MPCWTSWVPRWKGLKAESRGRTLNCKSYLKNDSLVHCTYRLLLSFLIYVYIYLYAYFTRCPAVSLWYFPLVLGDEYVLIRCPICINSSTAGHVSIHVQLLLSIYTLWIRNIHIKLYVLNKLHKCLLMWMFIVTFLINNTFVFNSFLFSSLEWSCSGMTLQSSS